MEDSQRERIKLCVRGLYDAQKLRIQLELRIARLVRDDLMTEEEAKAFFHLPFSWFEKAENAMEKMVSKETKDLPIVKKWLRRVRGIGPRLSGLLIANIYDIERFASPGKLYAYCGLHVKDGRAVKRAKGEKANWNSFLKTKLVGVLAGCILKANGEYRSFYDDYKVRVENRESCPLTKEQHAKKDSKVTWLPNGCTKGHVHNMALRGIQKLFLMDLFFAWYELLGIIPPTTYAEDKLGRIHKEQKYPNLTPKRHASQIKN